MKKSNFSSVYFQDIFSLYLITDLPILQATILTSSFCTNSRFNNEVLTIFPLQLNETQKNSQRKCEDKSI